MGLMVIGIAYRSVVGTTTEDGNEDNREGGGFHRIAIVYLQVPIIRPSIYERACVVPSGLSGEGARHHAIQKQSLTRGSALLASSPQKSPTTNSGACCEKAILSFFTGLDDADRDAAVLCAFGF